MIFNILNLVLSMLRFRILLHYTFQRQLGYSCYSTTLFTDRRYATSQMTATNSGKDQAKIDQTAAEELNEDDEELLTDRITKIEHIFAEYVSKIFMRPIIIFQHRWAISPEASLAFH